MRVWDGDGCGGGGRVVGAEDGDYGGVGRVRREWEERSDGLSASNHDTV